MVFKFNGSFLIIFSLEEVIGYLMFFRIWFKSIKSDGKVRSLYWLVILC